MALLFLVAKTFAQYCNYTIFDDSRLRSYKHNSEHSQPRVSVLPGEHHATLKFLGGAGQE